jgi:hypothetical protein
VAIEPDDKDWTWVLERPCPECGLDASTVRAVAVAELLRTNAGAWTRLLVAAPPGELRRRPRDDCWSALEYACHVRDVCALFRDRLGLMLEEDDPLFANWDQDATALEEDYGAQVRRSWRPNWVTRPPSWPTPSTPCAASNGSGRAAAATVRPSPWTPSAATWSTTRSTTSTT